MQKQENLRGSPCPQNHKKKNVNKVLLDEQCTRHWIKHSKPSILCQLLCHSVLKKSFRVKENTTQSDLKEKKKQSSVSSHIKERSTFHFQPQLVRGGPRTHNCHISGHNLHSYSACLILEAQIYNQPIGKPRGEESRTVHRHC